MDTPTMDGPEYNAELCCIRCWLDFDAFDEDDIAARKDGFWWRLRNFRERR